jgi:ABC-type transport system involved in cytochrome bd biosynthesis fused ATPase/permease subunit
VSERQRQFHAFYGELRIGDQLRYYSARATEYRDAHRQAVVVRNALLLAAAAVGVVAQLFEGGARAGLGVGASVLAALAGAITAYETLIGFPQLEKLYSDAARNLEEADADWREVDPAADLTAQVERVEGVFRSEMGQWGQLVVRSAAPAPPPAEPGPT